MLLGFSTHPPQSATALAAECRALRLLAFFGLSSVPDIGALNPETRALIAALVEVDRVAQEQARQSEELAEIKDEVINIRKTTGDADFFSVLGFARLKKLSIDSRSAIEYGKRAAKECKALGINPGKVPDPRYGQINSYPREILEKLIECPRDSFSEA